MKPLRTAQLEKAKLLVRVPNWIGDAVMCLPALRELRRALPGAEIALAGRPWVLDVFLPALRTSKGSVLNISSIAAMHTAARQPPYGAIKAAVIHYTGTQAAMYAKDGIRVNCIAPGSIEFPGGVWDRRKSDNPRLYNAVLSSIPFGRLGHPEEIANVALFLASPFASWVTGQTIAVDGGQLL